MTQDRPQRPKEIKNMGFSEASDPAAPAANFKTVEITRRIMVWDGDAPERVGDRLKALVLPEDGRELAATRDPGVEEYNAAVIIGDRGTYVLTTYLGPWSRDVEIRELNGRPGTSVDVRQYASEDPPGFLTFSLATVETPNLHVLSVKGVEGLIDRLRLAQALARAFNLAYQGRYPEEEIRKWTEAKAV